MKDAVINTTSHGSSTGNAGVPRIVWMLWFQGWDRAPQVCRRCKSTFELWNPGWEVRALSEADLPAVLADYCGEFSTLCEAMNPLASMGMSWIPPAAAADLLRLVLLSRFGGVWADASILCRKPLDAWIQDAAALADGFFAYSPEKAGEIPVMSSFLAARPQHPIVEAWLQRLRLHWLTPQEQRPDLGYFWLHTLFDQLVQDDETSRELWARAPKVSAEYEAPGPHRLMPYETVLAQVPSDEVIALIEGEESEPVYKMTIHDVKYDKAGGEMLLTRDGKALANAQDSGFEFILRRTVEQAQAHFEASQQQTKLGASASECRGSVAALPERTPAELAAYRREYRLKIAAQPMMPG